MSKRNQSKKSKVPKLTEAEYAAYLSSLRGYAETKKEAPMSAVNVEKSPQKTVENT